MLYSIKRTRDTLSCVDTILRVVKSSVVRLRHLWLRFPDFLTAEVRFKDAKAMWALNRTLLTKRYCSELWSFLCRLEERVP
jgi:hypothetical protein